MNFWNHTASSFLWVTPGTKRQNIWSSFIYSFFCSRPSDQKLGCSLIYLIYLHTTIRPKYIAFFHLFFLLCTTIRSKIRSSLIYFFYLYTIIRPKLKGHSYSLFYYFPNCANISYAIFIATLSSSPKLFIFWPSFAWFEERKIV